MRKFIDGEVFPAESELEAEGPGRIFHCMRWLGQAQRAFELMCQRANTRWAHGALLSEKGAIQVHGALGVTSDTPLERMYREARYARIYDGPDEVHRMVVA